MKNVYLLTVCFFLINCTTATKEKEVAHNEAPILFEKVTPEVSGITFSNVLHQRVDFNFMNYLYIYTGAGVAIGDIDNDGLEDLYFVSNQGPNKLYKNKGDFKFDDITNTARVEDYSGFSTGVTMMDINNDGWLDIYVCKAGSLNNHEERKNLLFINKKDGTFSEEAAQWGLADPAFSTQIYQIDYDKDGDLDLYLVNHRNDFQNNTKVNSQIQKNTSKLTSDQLYRNNGTNFTKVTKEAGLTNKAWGLSAVISDFNEDGWDDIYVANDFLEPDALYINQQNGTFKNEILTRLDHITTNSMGSDYADLNNDLMPDLITLDMMSENYARSKENMASMSISGFNAMVAVGYHHAYMANMLHVNRGKGKFYETGQFSGITKTDWSWAPLLADFDNDGLKDIFVTNGVDRDYTNQDVRTQLQQIVARGESKQLQEVLDLIPSERITNYIYKNEGNLNFSNKIEAWGLNTPTYSNGAAYGDLDNDGDLDLVVNNLYDPAGIYKNNAQNNFSKINLIGPSTNPAAIGASVTVKTANKTQVQELYTNRGYESTVSKNLVFGLGDETTIDEIEIKWPDGTFSSVKNPKANTTVSLNYTTSNKTEKPTLPKGTTKNTKSTTDLGLTYQHLENEFYDYGAQLLLPQRQSSKGTGIVKGDVNNDGLDDFFVGNAANASAALYIQDSGGNFTNSQTNLWNKEAAYEDANALFFDADGDGDQDLYVVSAGYELEANSSLLQDRLYINNGQGIFKKQTNALPKMLASGKTVTAADIDDDGDLDLYVGGNVLPKKYPLASASFLLENNQGTFKDITTNNPELSAPGMISEAIFTDYDGDNDADLLLVGEWMQPTFFTNSNGSFKKHNTPSLHRKEGWWFSVIAKDMDGDGDTDYFFGNLGKNNKFSPSEKKPLYIYAKDFDNNGSFDVALSKINEGKVVPVRGKECSSEQNPFLLEKIQSYKEFASLDMDAIYGADQLANAEKRTVFTFESVYAQNNGDGSFTLTSLPNVAQLGPTLSFIVEDFNNDGNLDIMGVGAIYDAEVETIRYDGNYGYVLLGDGNGDYTPSKAFDPYITSDAKDLISISINGKKHYAVVSNNAPLEIFTFQP